MPYVKHLGACVVGLLLSGCYQPAPTTLEPAPEPPESVPEPLQAVEPVQAIAPPRRVAPAPMMPMAPLLPSRCDSAIWASNYDMTFYLAAQHYLSPERRHRFCLLKSQAIAESGLRPEVESHAGAAGIAQFLTATWDETITQAGLPPGSSRLDPDVAIKAQAFYLNRLADVWLAPRSQGCRFRLALASYNSGIGNVIEAQKQSGGRQCWPDISPYQAVVTGDHATETINYVDRIDTLYSELSGDVLED